MTSFRALYTLLGLSQDRAERLLNINHKTIEHYLAGQRRRGGLTVEVLIRPGVLAELRRCWNAINDHADIVFQDWRRDPNQKTIIMPHVPSPVISGEWSAVNSDALAAGLLALELPDDVKIVIARRASTAAVLVPVEAPGSGK